MWSDLLSRVSLIVSMIGREDMEIARFPTSALSREDNISISTQISIHETEVVMIGNERLLEHN